METPPEIRQSHHPTRVLCVDDSRDMTAVMQLMIDAEPQMECVGCLHSANDLAKVARRLNPPPDVVILDATMPGKNPLASMAELAAEFPTIRTIILSGHDDAAFVQRAIDAGAWGCVSKREPPDAILRAVREAANGHARRPRADSSS